MSDDMVFSSLDELDRCARLGKVIYDRPDCVYSGSDITAIPDLLEVDANLGTNDARITELLMCMVRQIRQEADA